MARIAWEGLACVDCTLIIANDDDSSLTDPEAHRAAMAAQSTPGEYLVVTSKSDDDVIDFSAARCDVCGTHLAGTRHPVAALV